MEISAHTYGEAKEDLRKELLWRQVAVETGFPAHILTSNYLSVKILGFPVSCVNELGGSVPSNYSELKNQVFVTGVACMLI